MRSGSKTRLLFAMMFAAAAFLLREVAAEQVPSAPLTQTPSFYNTNLSEYYSVGAPAKSATHRTPALPHSPEKMPMKLGAMVLGLSNVEDTFISVRGLPDTAVFPKGMDAGDGQWLVRVTGVNELFAILPDGVPADLRPEIRLLRDDVGADSAGPITIAITVIPFI